MHFKIYFIYSDILVKTPGPAHLYRDSKSLSVSNYAAWKASVFFFALPTFPYP